MSTGHSSNGNWCFQVELFESKSPRGIGELQSLRDLESKLQILQELQNQRTSKSKSPYQTAIWVLRLVRNNLWRKSWMIGHPSGSITEEVCDTSSGSDFWTVQKLLSSDKADWDVRAMASSRCVLSKSSASGCSVRIEVQTLKIQKPKSKRRNSARPSANSEL